LRYVAITIIVDDAQFVYERFYDGSVSLWKTHLPRFLRGTEGVRWSPKVTFFRYRIPLRTLDRPYFGADLVTHTLPKGLATIRPTYVTIHPTGYTRLQAYFT